MSPKGEKIIPFTKPRISTAGTIAVSSLGKEVPVQVIYAVKTKRNLPMNNQFPEFTTTGIGNNASKS